MNRLKLIFSMALGIMFNAATAQQVQKPAKLPEKEGLTGFYKSKLNLNDSSATKVYTIMADYKTAAKTLMANPQMADAEKRKQLDKLIHQRNKQLRLILKPQQADALIPTSEKTNDIP